MTLQSDSYLCKANAPIESALSSHSYLTEMCTEVWDQS